MIIVDTALERRRAEGNPVKVAIVGAGFAASGLVMQIVGSTPGMDVVVLCNRTIETAEQAYRGVGVEDFVRVASVSALEQAIATGRRAVTDDPAVACAAGQVEAVVEATGEIEYGAQVALHALENGKHLILVNAELDSTLGPILKTYADSAGVVLTDTDGDQPGVLMNLVREARMLGFEPLLAGNIKSLLDHYRTPTTQKAFAEAVFQRPKMITSFADGTKISAEMATLGNGLGYGVSRRGMTAAPCEHVDQAAAQFDLDGLRARPVVDYILGAEPSFGVFVLAESDKPLVNRYMKIYKMGDGPVYTFYRPYHLSPLETPLTIARAVLFGDATLAPSGAPTCDVITLAKRDLSAGETLDGIGGYTSYGDIDNTPIARAADLLPMGLSDGCTLLRDISKDAEVRFSDVRLPPNRVSDRLWQEQVERFPAG